MGSSHPQQDHVTHLRLVGMVHHDQLRELAQFLTSRLTEDLATVWARDAASYAATNGPGMAAQVAVPDELLATLRDGRLPSLRELRVMLYEYSRHRDYDPSWATLQQWA